MKAFSASKPRSAVSREPLADSSSAATRAHSQSAIPFDFKSIAIHPVIQAKPRVSGPEDLAEKKADAIADDVASEEGVVTFTDPNRKGSAMARPDDEDDEIRRAAADNARIEEPDDLRARLFSRRPGGKAIPPAGVCWWDLPCGASRRTDVRILPQ